MESATHNNASYYPSSRACCAQMRQTAPLSALHLNAPGNQRASLPLLPAAFIPFLPGQDPVARTHDLPCVLVCYFENTCTLILHREDDGTCDGGDAFKGLGHHCAEEGLFMKGRKKRGAISAASAGIASERDKDGLVVEGERLEEDMDMAASEMRRRRTQ